MKIYPETRKGKDETPDIFSHLTPLQKIMRQLALLLAFVSVFVFFVKILFL